MDVSRHAYIGGKLSVGNNPTGITLTWYADSAATVALGSRRFIMQPGQNNDGGMRIPNLGPFLQITGGPLGGLTASQTFTVFATNRTHPVEFISALAMIFEAVAIPVNAGLGDQRIPIGMFAGPVQFLFTSLAGPWGLSFTCYDQFDIATIFHRRSLPVGDSNFTVITPPGAWNTSILNNSGVNSSYTLVGIPTLTGSS
jgi:hypothetical protein